MIYFRYEWSDWLTPIGLKKQTKRRFDTIFYIAFQETMLETSLDNKEITSMQFADPIDIMQRHLNGELWLAPPQFWEISRMINIHNFEDLKTFSIAREHRGCETWLPVLQHYSGGYYSIYPGDDLYPKNPDFYGKEASETGCDDEARGDEEVASQNMNRMKQNGLHDYTIHVNVEDPFGHFIPKSIPRMREKTDNKL